MDRTKKRICVFLVLTVQLLVSLLFLKLLHAPVLEGDTGSYLHPAYNLLKSGFFSEDGIHAMYFRVPGYSIFLATILAIFNNLYIVCIIQVILNICAALLIYKSVLLYTKNELLPFIAMILFCLEINLYLYAATILTETLFLFLIALSLYLFCLWRQEPERLAPFLGLSLAIMASLLVKPAIMYLALLVCIVLVFAACFKKIALKHAVVYIVLFAAVFGGWSFRNYMHSGHFVYSTIRHIQFYRWDAQILMADIEGISNDEVAEIFAQKLEEKVNGKSGLNEVDTGLLSREIGNEYIFAHFADYFKMNVIGLATLLVGPGRFYINQLFTDPVINRLVMLSTAGYIFLLEVLYATGILINTKKKKLMLVDIVLLLCIGYFAVAHASLGYSRYRLTFYPLLAAGVVFLWKDIIEQKLINRVMGRTARLSITAL